MRTEDYIERLFDLAQQLEGEKVWRIKELVNHYGVSRSAINKSLKRLGRICCLIGDRKGYRIKPGGNPLPIPITQKEIQALKVAVSAQPIAENDRFRQPIQTLIEKLDNFLAERIHQAIE